MERFLRSLTYVTRSRPTPSRTKSAASADSWSKTSFLGFGKPTVHSACKFSFCNRWDIWWLTCLWVMHISPAITLGFLSFIYLPCASVAWYWCYFKKLILPLKCARDNLNFWCNLWLLNYHLGLAEVHLFLVKILYVSEAQTPEKGIQWTTQSIKCECMPFTFRPHYMIMGNSCQGEHTWPTHQSDATSPNSLNPELLKSSSANQEHLWESPHLQGGA